jgi:hypothetical protein
MRFVSNSPRLGLGTAQKERFQLTSDGELHKIGDSLPVTFTQEYLMQTDIDFALHVFPEDSFRGRYMESDEVTLEPVAGRIGVYDTVEEQAKLGWDDATREKVEQWLLAKTNLGQDFVQVEKIVGLASKPWPSYDEAHHFKIPALAAELGLLEEALAYEQANKNRESVVSGLEEKLAIPADAVAGEVIAA